jgi:hypothetical protein
MIMALRRFWCTAAGLRGVEHLLAEEFNPCSAVGLALEQLEALHLALAHAVAPFLGQSRLNGCMLTPQPRSQACQCLHTTCLRLRNPCVELGAAPLTHQPQELLGQTIRRRDQRVKLAKLLDKGLLRH